MSQLTIGQYLNQVRSAKNLSIRQASEHTKINERLLRDFEADKFEKLPNVAYLKGFLKQLAIVFEFNYEEAVDLLEKTIEQKSSKNDKRPRTDKFFSVHVLLQDLAQTIVLMKSVFSLRILISLAVTLVFAVSLYLAGFYLIKKEPFRPADVPVQVTKKVSKTEPEVTKSIAQEKQEIFLNGKNSECWIAYKIDSQPVRNLTLNSGEKLRLEGHVIRLSLGKPESVDIRYRDSEVDLKPYITSGGTAHLIFPFSLFEKNSLPFFVFNRDGTISTRTDHPKQPRTN